MVKRIVPWDVVETHAPEVLQKLMHVDLPRETFLNLNFPNCKPEDVRGIAVDGAGASWISACRWKSAMTGAGFPYYWLRFGDRQGPFCRGARISMPCAPTPFR